MVVAWKSRGWLRLEGSFESESRWGLKLDASGGGVEGCVGAATSLVGGALARRASFLPGNRSVLSIWYLPLLLIFTLGRNNTATDRAVAQG